jgi:serine/threonine-protein kinase
MEAPRPQLPSNRTSPEGAGATQPPASAAPSPTSSGTRGDEGGGITQGYEDTQLASVTQSTPKAPQGSGSREKLTSLGEFQLTKKLGAGGMGVVYKAHQTSLDRPVALKVLAKHLAANPAFVDRFYREARTMAKLDHPNIIHGYAVGEEHGWHYFAMEYVDGDSMEAWVERLGKLDLGDVLHIGLRCAEALGYAHQRQLVHRDIKPGNILVTSDGKVKIADLGLAKALDEEMSLTQSGTGMGTPYYMPPEQARNAKHVDGRSDIYALGATLYHLLAGKLPFQGQTTVELIEAKQKGEYPPARRFNPEVPERLDLILDKTLSPDPNHRYQDCQAFLRDLESVGAPNERLTFLLTSQGPGNERDAMPSPTAPMKTTAATSQTAVVSEPVWYVRRAKPGAPQKAHKLSHGVVKDLIRNGRLDSSTEASRQRAGPYRPLGSFAELEQVFQQRKVQSRAQQHAEKYDKLYDDIYRQERRRRFWRWMGDHLRNIAGWTIILAIVAGVLFVAVRFGVPWIKGNARSFGDSFQERLTPEASGDQ